MKVFNDMETHRGQVLRFVGLADVNLMAGYYNELNIEQYESGPEGPEFHIPGTRYNIRT
jgi:hypothetical protein